VGKKSIELAMDSLVTLKDRETGRRSKQYCPKFFIVPHLQGVMCGVGDYDFVLDWYMHLCGEVHRRFRDFDAPQRLFTSNLRDLLADGRNRYIITQTDQTSIFHFGYSDLENRFVGFEYCSGNNFKPQLIANDGLVWTEPNAEIDDLVEKYKSSDRLFTEVIKRQRKENEDVPIGGSVYYLYMDKSRTYYKEIYEFEDK